MILHINRRIRALKATNVVAILADPDDPLLPDRSVNRFFFCDSWHHIENQTKYLALMKKMLKPGGEIVMIDFHKKESPIGPPLQMKIAREDLIKQMESQRLSARQGTLHFCRISIFCCSRPSNRAPSPALRDDEARKLLALVNASRIFDFILPCRTYGRRKRSR